MCGISGFFGGEVFQTYGESGVRKLLEDITDTISHRGPDQAGYWLDRNLCIAFGHRRLSIVDLTPTGAQPMQSTSGRYTICYNGEIYNFKEIRKQLESTGERFRGTSDTEVLLKGIDCYGLDNMLSRCHGMFAFALYDHETGNLNLVRDRVGEKPLYYGFVGDTLVFGSELKVFRNMPGWSPKINRDALLLYFRHNYIPTPHTIYQSIYKLPAGSKITFSLKELSRQRHFHPDVCSGRSEENVSPISYWRVPDALESSTHLMQGSHDQQEALEQLITTSVARQMVADVPLGAFLSGGIDSSAIVALMAEQSSNPIKTFTIGFGESEYNEAKNAAKIASHLGTDHHEFTLTANDALELVPSLPHHFDEPFADSSQLPTMLVSRVTRSVVTVALSGDGGDELFAGYDRYRYAEKLWRYIGALPVRLRAPMAFLLKNMPTAMLKIFAPLLPGKSGSSQSAAKFRRLAEMLVSKNADDLYRLIISHESNPEELVNGGKEPNYEYSKPAKFGDTMLSNMMGRDIKSYLLDDILTKVDRASMSVSLEVRVPLLCHDVIAMAWSMKPDNAQSDIHQTKIPLRKILYKRVPRELVERPKSGFAIPLSDWLNGPLKNWANDLLDSDLIRRQGLLNVDRVNILRKQHFDGSVDHQYRLWNLLMLQAWLEGQSA
ncbi:MAG: asparagine synthase (glutamine-hydrolyzing) [Parasphingorhabdus sp.]|jgi:asparagine synthase (glutamine-hydrolysing)